ncbi:MAG: hypothetical protein RLZZ28_1429 [Bacteroidota bacterium]|jgi:hypothetical protein
MAGSGYSGKPLEEKLGIKPGMRIRLINQPADYFTLVGQQIAAQVVKSGEADLYHLFVISKKVLEKEFAAIIQHCGPKTIIWISWYKQSAGQKTDITENIIRELVLPTGWVDVKVCAVNESWSGLKMVKRLEKS